MDREEDQSRTQLLVWHQQSTPILVHVAFADMVEVNEGTSSSSSRSSEWYLLTESAMWGMVDVTETNTQQLVNSTIHIVRSTVKEANGRPSGEKVCSYIFYKVM